MWLFFVVLVGVGLSILGAVTGQATLTFIGLGFAGSGIIHASVPDRGRFRRCMTNTARMEIEAYGMIVSQSVEWWLTDNNAVLCAAHPFPDLPMMVTGHICTCPTKPSLPSPVKRMQPPQGPGSASKPTRVTTGYIASGTIASTPPPAPSRNHCSGCRHCSAAAKAGLCCCECERAWYQDPCVRECPLDTISADGKTLYAYCTKHGRKTPWPLPPSRPSPTTGVTY